MSGSVPSFSAPPLLLYDPSRAKDEGDHDGSFVPSAQGRSGAAGGNRGQASEGAAGAPGAGQPVRAALGSGAGTKLTYVCLCRVDDTSADLRRHAAHCRELAHATFGDRMRTILLTMASEFDSQARAIDARRPPLER